MANSKLIQANKKIEEKVVGGYKKIEKNLVDNYTKMQDNVVNGYQKIEDHFVEQYLTQAGETTEDAPKRLKAANQNRKLKVKDKSKKTAQ